MINELRINNWVKAPLGEQMQVKQLGHKDNPDYIFAEGPEGFGTNGFEGIPLSPEILEKCGFVKAHSSNEYWTFWRLENGWHIGEAHHSEPSAGVEAGSCYWGDDYTRIKHLHQLQNLYYALTSSELTYKP